MKRPLRGWSRSATLWFCLAAVWLAHLFIAGSLIAFRAVKTSGIAQTFEFQDVPMLAAFDGDYAVVLIAAALLGAAAFFGVLAAGISSSESDDGRDPRLRFAAAHALLLLLLMFSCRYANTEGSSVDVQPSSWMDWAVIGLSVYASAGFIRIALQTIRNADCPEAHAADERRRPLLRLSIVFLLGCVSIIVYALREHLVFWHPELNGNYDYARFFLPEEIPQAKLVFYSTSVAFAAVAALGGCAAWCLFRWVSRAGERTGAAFHETDCVRQGVLLAAFWSFCLSVPWQSKILPEIIADRGWILPTVSLLMNAAALSPLFAISAWMFKQDFDWACTAPHVQNAAAQEFYRTGFRVRRSEAALWNVLLFAVYPVVRFPFLWVRMPWIRWTCLMLASAAAIAGLTFLFHHIEDLYDFEDWRGMLKAGLFPFLRVLMSLLAAWWLYLVGIRVVRGVTAVTSKKPGAIWRWSAMGLRAVVVLAAMGMAGLAAWPFWGWSDVSKNVFYRAVEYNDRHEFELRFLHWLFDADRDGYAAVLHGADPDDLNADLGAGGISGPQAVKVPIDEFEIAEPGKTANAPNVVIFYLEGVTPRAISAYGKRRLPAGLIATPHMDSVATDGTLFTNARCYYPSTWDAWFAVNSGRYLRIFEMHAGGEFGNRYSRYSNLYKVLELAGITRYCHSDVSPYADLFLPEHFHGNPETEWQPDDEVDTSLSSDEEEAGLWRGDKRADRMVAFLDDLKPGEKFFLCEHMSDTHFPWKRTTKERAKELGFPDGLEPYEQDDSLPKGGTHSSYTNYLQTVTRMDGQIGRVLNKLKEKGLYDQTMIVIVSDHGCQWFEHEHMYYVSHLYEQSLHVPLIVKAPGLPQGVITHEPVIQIDVLPTVMELAGIRHANPHSEYPFTCQSLVPLMRGKRSPEISERFQNRDMILCTHYDTLGVISNFREKLIFDRPTGTYLVFDLQEDPDEMHNLADSNPEMLARLLERLQFLANRHKSFVGSIAGDE